MRREGGGGGGKDAGGQGEDKRATEARGEEEAFYWINRSMLISADRLVFIMEETGNSMASRGNCV